MIMAVTTMIGTIGMATIWMLTIGIIVADGNGPVRGE
jgi:hypothetical protein